MKKEEINLESLRSSNKSKSKSKPFSNISLHSRRSWK